MVVLEIIGCSKGFDFYVDVLRGVDEYKVFFTNIDNKESVINTFNSVVEVDDIREWIEMFLENNFNEYSLY